jgi:hypothetical protein
MEQQFNNSIPQSTLPEKRPILISALCIFGFLSFLFSMSWFFIPFARNSMIQAYGVVFVPVSLLIYILGLIGFIGYWKMKKWGVYTYTTMAVLSIGYSLILGISGIYIYLFPIVTVAVGFANLKKMN